MKALRPIFLTLFCALAAASFLVGCRAQPKYEGKKLGQWLKIYDRARTDSPEEKRAEQAIRSIGTNGLPFLIASLEDASNDYFMNASCGFGVLGETAAPAVPELARLLYGTNELSALLAAQSLAKIGAPAAPILFSALTNENYRVSSDAALVLPDLGSNAAPAIPFFLSELHHPKTAHRQRAIVTLGDLALQPDLVVPALTEALSYRTTTSRLLALSALKEFGTNARPALPEIMELRSDTNFTATVTEALLEIAPDILTNPSVGKRESLK